MLGASRNPRRAIPHITEDAARRLGTEQGRAIQHVVIELPLLLLARYFQAHRQTGFFIGHLAHRVRIQSGIHQGCHRESESIFLKSEVDDMSGRKGQGRVVAECRRQSRCEGDDVARIRRDAELLSARGDGKYIARDRIIRPGVDGDGRIADCRVRLIDKPTRWGAIAVGMRFDVLIQVPGCAQSIPDVTEDDALGRAAPGGILQTPVADRVAFSIRIEDDRSIVHRCLEVVELGTCARRPIVQIGSEGRGRGGAGLRINPGIQPEDIRIDVIRERADCLVALQGIHGVHIDLRDLLIGEEKARVFPLVERDRLARQGGVARCGARIARRDGCGGDLGRDRDGDGVASVASDCAVRRIDKARHYGVFAQYGQAASDQFVNNGSETISHNGSSP